MATQIIIQQILVFAFLAIVGVIAQRAGIFSDESRRSLARIIIDITLPFLIFSTFTHVEFTPALMQNAAIVFVLVFVNLAVLLGTGTLSSKILKLKGQQADVHTLHTMFGNIVFLGFPLFDALFPKGIGVFYAAIYQLASNSVTFTYGIYRLSGGTQKQPWKRLLNLNTAALTLGIIVMATGIKIPDAVSGTCTSVGKCTSPLSMIYIGALLASMKLNSSFKNLSIYILSLNKLLIVPISLAFIYIVSLRFLGIQISHEAFTVLTMQIGMPCQTIIVVMSQRYNSDFKLAAGNLFITSLLSLFTLPLLYVVIDFLYCYL